MSTTFPALCTQTFTLAFMTSHVVTVIMIVVVVVVVVVVPTSGTAPGNQHCHQQDEHCQLHRSEREKKEISMETTEEGYQQRRADLDRYK